MSLSLFQNLGVAFESLGSFGKAVDCYHHSVATFNDVRSRLKFNGFTMSLCNLHQVAYANLWCLLVKQGKFLEGLFSAEQARAQALKDLIELKYSVKQEAGSGTGNKTINDMLSCLPSNTVVIAIEKQEVIFWVCQKGNGVQLRRKQISGDDDAYTFPQSLIRVMCQEIGKRSAKIVPWVWQEMKTLHVRDFLWMGDKSSVFSFRKVLLVLGMTPP